MATTGSLTRQLAQVADALGPVLISTDSKEQLVDLCNTVRLSVGAAAVSLARLDADSLVYEAAAGAGAELITGVRLPVTRGIAGYVARTGQSLVVDEVRSDPRFARDVAERAGYVPTSLLVVPVVDRDDVVLGVLSVLDRTTGTGDPLAVASAAGRVAAPLLAAAGAVTRLGPLLVRALADAAARGDATLVPALRRLADDVGEDDDETADMAAVAALVAELRVLSPSSRRAIERVLRETIALAAPRRRW